MQIYYKNKKIKSYCTDATRATKKYGPINAKIIQQRIQELECSESVEWMIQNNIGHCHALTGNRQGQYSIRLDGGFRLIFRCDEIDIIMIEEIVDYH